MKRSKKIIIPLKGIQDGEHDFDFQIVDEFFNDYQESEILGGEVQVRIHMDKKPQHIEVYYDFSGYLTVSCDKCLDAYNQEVDGNGVIYVKFGEEQENYSDELFFLPESESELDLTHFMYESTQLSLPYRRVHPDDAHGHSTCNQMMLEKLKIHKVNRKNETMDPRWEVLRKIRNSN